MTAACLLVALDNDSIVWSNKRSVAQHGFLELELRPRIGQLRPSALRLACRNGNELIASNESEFALDQLEGSADSCVEFLTHSVGLALNHVIL